MILNRRESATVIAGLRLLAGDGVRVSDYPYLVAGLYDETDPEYELRFDADEEYIRELIDRIDEMSLPRSEAALPVHRKSTGEMARETGGAPCADCDRNVGRRFVLQKGAPVSWRTTSGIG